MLPISPNQSTQPSLASYIPKLASAFSDTQERTDDPSESNVQIGNGVLNNLTIGNNNTANNHIHLAAVDSKLIETLMLQHIFALQPNIKPLVNLDSAIEALQKRYEKSLEEDNEVKDALSKYVEPEGMELHDSTRFDLKSKIQDFLNSNKKVLLLLGEAGSGKSTFNRDFAVSLWAAYTQASAVRDSPIPVFIQLSSSELKSKPNLVEKFFEIQGFSKEQIKELQTKHRFVLILDGFDEIKERQRDFYKDNQLNNWRDAKIIISSRPEYLGSNYQYKFHSSGERSALQEYRLAPFSEKTIEQYVDQYKKVHPEGPWSAEQYKEALKQRDLKELVGNPFLLKITLSMLPELRKKLQAEGQRFTRIGLYDEFVNNWFERSQRRLAQIQLNSEEAKEFRRLEQTRFVERGMGFSKKLALEMYRAGEVVSTYLATADDPWEEPSVESSQAWRKRFLGNDNAMTVLMRLNAPLICQGDQYRFIHKSLQDYFVARALWEELGTNKIKFSSWLNTLNIVNDPAILSFLAERVQQERELKEHLLSVVEQSKGEEGAQFEVSTANALTVLVKGGVSLSSKDFSGINARGADLGYGIFDSTQFTGADLREVNWYRAWLKKANLDRANLSGCELGERPTLEMKTEVYACCYSPDGRWLAISEGSDIHFYQTYNLEKSMTYSVGNDWVTSIAFSHNGRWLAASSGSTVKLWHLSEPVTWTPAEFGSKHDSDATSVSFSPNGEWIVSGSEDKTVKLWSISGTPVLIRTYTGHGDKVTSVAFSPDGQWIASGSEDKTIKLWSIFPKEPARIYTGHEEAVTSVAFSPDGKMVASGSADKTVKLWDISKTLGPLHTYVGHSEMVSNVAFSPDGNWLASSGWDNTVKLWNLSSNALMHTYAEHQDMVATIAFSPDSQWIASGSEDRTLKIYGVSGARAFSWAYKGHGSRVNSVTFSQNGRYLVTSSDDSTVKLWSFPSMQVEHTYTRHKFEVRSAALSPNGQWIISGGDDNTVMLWKVLGGGDFEHAYIDDECPVTSVAFSGDGEWLASGSLDGRVRLWNTLGERDLIHTSYIGHQWGVNSIAFSPDGQWLASGGKDGTIKLWGLIPLWKFEIRNFSGHEDQVSSVAFSPDSEWLISGSEDKTLKLWNAFRAWSPERTYVGHQKGVTSVAFSNDGRWIASGSRDNTVRVWSVNSGECQTILQDFVGAVCSVAWQTLPDGVAMLATGEEDKAVRLWRVFHNIDRVSQVTLEWTSWQGELNATEALIENAHNLSSQNAALLRQRGARQTQINQLYP
ncbi:WD40 repeat-containing protein [Mycoavidus cysteinexigens]|uniref:WD40 repeat-containing protein n=1 Tax=Mycoavidus cysteinexigens TaxID=1553431 RepID=A0A2Z6EWA5_9BURK|nr:NACHT domain-containing protein [Mycoavidus cysteinexigens]BBE09682.1 WD40 repeat-containing protein [Mycoavidus cysteinexigens]GAM51578.1 hypothetical protein EBME_0041 [bacterium endosymbiont of Mortierella elongata FMR23-6]GLR01376.1 hypothetical protein GCM10007934_11880 [Mycoavidus cysteinexigens]